MTSKAKPGAPAKRNQYRQDFMRGDKVRDLNGNLRTVVAVHWSFAYELDGQPETWYQPDEVSKLRRRRK